MTATKEGNEDAATRDMAVALPSLPPKVAAAITKVMAGVTKLGKDERNPFANYSYAGIEAFLEMVRPLCADAGLIIIQDEEGFEFRDAADAKGKVLTWLVMTFSFGIAHSSGETWPHRLKRTGMVQASMGSQAFGAAQSYALKSFLRSIGMIATGDTEDADSHEQRDLPRVRSHGASQITRGQPALSKEKSRPVYEALIKEMRSLRSQSELTAWGLESTDRIYSMHDDYQRWFREEYGNHLTAIKEGVDENGAELAEPEQE